MDSNERTSAGCFQELPAAEAASLPGVNSSIGFDAFAPPTVPCQSKPPCGGKRRLTIWGWLLIGLALLALLLSLFLAALLGYSAGHKQPDVTTATAAVTSAGSTETRTQAPTMLPAEPTSAGTAERPSALPDTGDRRSPLVLLTVAPLLGAAGAGLLFAGRKERI
ncbi:MAG: LPXTG cell wall anchor domain-containing protein [Oscillospiraceae bacterium]|nr:LPXTG cell wall anchor domain-containing protein [Oscillospiraceae bacterium]